MYFALVKRLWKIVCELLFGKMGQGLLDIDVKNLWGTGNPSTANGRWRKKK